MQKYTTTIFVLLIESINYIFYDEYCYIRNNFHAEK